MSDDATGALLRRAMFGPGSREADGPPYEHVLRLPETEEEMYGIPEPSLTVLVKGAEQRTCRHCGTGITHGPRGWRDDEDGPLAYGCPDAPLGFHEAAVGSAS